MSQKLLCFVIKKWGLLFCNTNILKKSWGDDSIRLNSSNISLVIVIYFILSYQIP